MKKAIFTLAVLVMAFGNVSLAQRETILKSTANEQVFKHYGLLRSSSIKPTQAMLYLEDGSKQRVTYTYDEYDFYLVEEFHEVSVANGWQNQMRVNYEYDFSGNVLYMIGQTWTNSNWEDMIQATYTYDGDDLSEVVYQMFVNGTWMNFMKEVYNYNGNTSTILFWSWNGTTWSTQDLYTYTYNDDSIELLMQYMQGGAWQNEAKETSLLDFTGNVTEILEEEWENNAWVNNEKIVYNYEGQLYTSMVVSEWDNGAWVDDSKFEFVYEGGNAVYGECKHMEDGQWELGDGDIMIAYDNNAEIIEYDCMKVEVTYTDITGLNENTSVNFMSYPVPAEQSLSIEAEGFQRAEIFSVTGQEVLVSEKNVLDVSNLKAGVYLLKVFNNKGNSATQRIVVK